MPPPAATQAAARLWTVRVTNPPHLPAFRTSVESTTPPAVQTRFTRGRVRELKNGHNSVTVQNRTRVYMNFFHHKGIGNHLLQLCPKSWNTLYSCTDRSRNSRSFLLWWAVCSSYAFLRLERRNQNGHWNHHRWHATNSLERTRFSCWCL